MIKSRSIVPNAVLEITAKNGERFLMRVIRIVNGRVILARHHTRGRGQWWLPIDYVKENAIRLYDLETATRGDGD